MAVKKDLRCKKEWWGKILNLQVNLEKGNYKTKQLYLKIKVELKSWKIIAYKLEIVVTGIKDSKIFTLFERRAKILINFKCK